MHDGPDAVESAPGVRLRGVALVDAGALAGEAALGRGGSGQGQDRLVAALQLFEDVAAEQA